VPKGDTSGGSLLIVIGVESVRVNAENVGIGCAKTSCISCRPAFTFTAFCAWLNAVYIGLRTSYQPKRRFAG
jgi:hypothetical protein